MFPYLTEVVDSPSCWYKTASANGNVFFKSNQWLNHQIWDNLPLPTTLSNALSVTTVFGSYSLSKPGTWHRPPSADHGRQKCHISQCSGIIPLGEKWEKRMKSFLACFWAPLFPGSLVDLRSLASFAVLLPNSDLAKHLCLFRYSSGGACFHYLCQVTDCGKLGAPELRYTNICMHV